MFCLVQKAWQHHKQQCQQQRPLYPSVTAVLCTDLAELIYSLLFHMHQAPIWSLASAAAGPRAAAERFAENQLLKLLGASATVRLGGPSWLVLLRVLYAEQLWCVSNGSLLRLQTDSDGCGREMVDDCSLSDETADGWNQAAGGAWCAGAFYTVHNDRSLRAFSAVSLQWQHVAHAGCNMPTKCALAAAWHSTMLVRSGGLMEDGSVLDSVSCWDVLKQSWTDLPRMNTARHSHGMAVTADKLIYVAGGESTSGEALSSVKVFDLVTPHHAQSDSTPIGVERLNATLRARTRGLGASCSSHV